MVVRRLAGGVRGFAVGRSAFAALAALASGFDWWWASDRRGLDSPRTPVLLAGVCWFVFTIRFFVGRSLLCPLPERPIVVCLLPAVVTGRSSLIRCAHFGTVQSSGGPLVGVFATHAGVRTLRRPTSDLAVSTHTCLRIVVATQAPAVRRTHSSSPDFF